MTGRAVELLVRLAAVTRPAVAQPAGDQPGPDQARELARVELQRREYAAAKPPLLNRLVDYAIGKLNALTDQAAQHLPGGTKSLVLLVIVMVALATVLVVRLQPTTGSRQPGGGFDGGQVLSAAAHRRLADEAAAQARYAEAVRERLRAIVRELEARGVLDSRPGRTAGEVARDASAAVPRLAGPLRRAALTFDQIWYGPRVADAAAYAVLVAVDQQVTTQPLVPV